MNTLIVPCGGKSSRFPDMRPKWLLTHPDGSLMLDKAISCLNLEIFDRIIVTVIKEHSVKYEAGLIIQQAFQDNPKIEICELPEFTESVVDTVEQTIQKMNVSGSIVIKDCDNYVTCTLDRHIVNAIAGIDIVNSKPISNLSAKSFLIVNDQNIIMNIIEKKLVSQIVCVGIYCFEDAGEFISGSKELHSLPYTSELYISHLISNLLLNHKAIFHYIPSRFFKDFGTIKEWRDIQMCHQTYFIDFDGVLIKNSGQYGSQNWKNNTDILEDNVTVIKELQCSGAQIIITTSRPEDYRERIIQLLNNVGIHPHAIVCGLNHSPRVLINDFAPSNPYPSARAVSLPRDSSLRQYFQM